MIKFFCLKNYSPESDRNLHHKHVDEADQQRRSAIGSGVLLTEDHHVLVRREKNPFDDNLNTVKEFNWPSNNATNQYVVLLIHRDPRALSLDH